MSEEVAPFAKPTGRLGFLFENFEFTDLDLQEISATEEGIHCHKCVHHYFSYSWLVILLACLIASGVLLFITYSDFLERSAINIRFFRLLLYVIIAIVFAWAFFTLREIILNRLQTAPFPIIGRNSSVEITEEISGTVSLEPDGLYSEYVAEQRGNLCFATHLTPQDYQRFLRYRAKFNLTPRVYHLYHAGFLLFRSKAAIYFDDSLALMPQRVNTLALVKNSREQTLFTRQRVPWHWQAKFPFVAQHPFDQPELIPLQIVPTIVSEDEQMTALELTIQVHPDVYTEALEITNPRIVELTLTGPSELISVKSAFPPHSSPNNQPVVQWHQVKIDNGDENARFGIFYVRFEYPVRAGMVFQGKLHARFDRSLSGIKDICVFYPLGHMRENADIYVKYYTDVIIEFSLNLQQILFRRQVTLEEPSISRKGVIPDHRTINELIRALSSNGYYVQRVVENPPRTNRAHANVINRFWDVAGRLYERLYPIDFHLVVSGKEVYEEGKDQPVPTRSESIFDLTVQATITDVALRERVERVKEQLRLIIEGL